METPIRSNKTEYIIGNTVRKLNNVPYREEMLPTKRLPLTEEEFKERRRGKQAAPKRKEQTKTSYANGIDLVSLLVLSAAIIVTLVVCVNFLMVQSDIISMSKETANLESDLVKLQNENNTNLQRINTSVDLTYVYKMATKELGMVHADKDHIITYDKIKSDYARKYAEIPDVENNSLLNKILDK